MTIKKDKEMISKSSPSLKQPSGKIVKRRFSRRCFCTIFLIVLIFLLILGLMIVLPVVKYIKTTMKENEAAQKNIKTKNKGPKIGPTKVNKPLVLIDKDTPKDARTIQSTRDETYELVFSDEFNKDGRTFFPGDDPVWEAVDLWYEPTGDLEYYKPDHVTTQQGNLVITIDDNPVGELKYTSGMIQSWNKVCFQGGRLEVRVSLPGSPRVSGLWPGAWTLGNLARAGYKATSDGTWPYSYDTCDSAVAANQSSSISNLNGQRLNKCVCKGEDHPNPGKGRGAPEIDLIESTSHPQGGSHVSQSLQVAPFDFDLKPNYEFTEIYNSSITERNPYTGSKLQQAVSGLTTLKDSIFNGNDYETFSIEYELGDDGYITWFVGDKPTWTLKAEALAANSKSKVNKRPIPEEPLYIIFNLAISESFTTIDYSKLDLPAHFLVDYVRLYQHPKRKSITCDPKDYPTSDYIKKHELAYYNKNITSWEKAGYKNPSYNTNGKC